MCVSSLSVLFLDIKQLKDPSHYSLQNAFSYVLHTAYVCTGCLFLHITHNEKLSGLCGLTPSLCLTFDPRPSFSPLCSSVRLFPSALSLTVKQIALWKHVAFHLH